MNASNDLLLALLRRLRCAELANVTFRRFKNPHGRAFLGQGANDRSPLPQKHFVRHAHRRGAAPRRRLNCHQAGALQRTEYVLLAILSKLIEHRRTGDHGAAAVDCRQPRNEYSLKFSVGGLLLHTYGIRGGAHRPMNASNGLVVNDAQHVLFAEGAPDPLHCERHKRQRCARSRVVCDDIDEGRIDAATCNLHRKRDDIANVVPGHWVHQHNGGLPSSGGGVSLIEAHALRTHRCDHYEAAIEGCQVRDNAQKCVSRRQRIA